MTEGNDDRLALKACNSYDGKVAWALKRELREDIKADPAEAVRRWAPFIENTLGVKI